MSGTVTSNVFKASGVIAATPGGLDWSSAVITGSTLSAETGRGYFINIIINEGKFVGTITHKGRTQVTKKSFNKSIDAQKYTASEMFLMLKDLHNK
jgi:hypothetical protein